MIDSNSLLRRSRALAILAGAVALVSCDISKLTQAKPAKGVGVATKLVFTVQPTTAPTLTAITPAVKVTLQDADGNTITDATNSITISLATNPGTATLSGVTTATPSLGVATFSNLQLNAVGTGYSLRASATGLTAATSSLFNIVPGNCTKLVFLTTMANAVAGQNLASFQVECQDQTNARNTSATGTITLTLNNAAGATLTGTTATMTAGVATFASTSINKTGTGYTLSATSSTSGITVGTSSTFNITPAAASKVDFAVQPTNACANSPITPSPQIGVYDSFGNLVTTSVANVTLGLGTNPGGATLTGGATQAASAGLSTFNNVSLSATGTGYTLTAASSGLTGSNSTPFNITAAGAPTKLVFLVQPTAVVAGASITPPMQVEIQDAAGCRVSSSTATVTLAIGTNPASGVLSGTTSVAAVNGVATFSGMSINRSSTTGYTLVATSSGLTSVTSNSFIVSPGAVTQMFFGQGPTNANTNTAISPTVRVNFFDAQGNFVSTATNSVSLAIGTNPASGTLTGGGATSAIAGTASFGALAINNAGTGYTLVANSSGLASITSSAFNIVAAGTPCKLGIVQQPTNVVAGSAIAPPVTVEVQDCNGTRLSSNNGTSIVMGINSNPGSATLSGTLSATTSSGVASFSTLSLNKTGTGYTLVASSTNLTSVVTSSFNVTPAAPSQLQFGQQPTTTAFSTNIAPPITVRVLDAFGNLATTAVNSISLAIGTDANPTTTLTGGGAVAASAGIATFSAVQLNKSGVGYTLVASSSTLTSATSSPFNSDPQVVYSGQDPYDMVRIGTDLYWIPLTNTSLVKGSTTGTATTTLASSIGANVTKLVTDNVNFYWLDEGATAGTGAIKKMPIAGGTITVLASGLSNAGYTGNPSWNSFATDGVNVYFTGSNAGNTAMAIRSIPIGGGSITDLVSTGTSGAPSFIVSGGQIYFNDPSVTSVRRMPSSGGAVTTLGSGTAVGLALVGTTLYFHNGTTVQSITNATTASGPVTPTVVYTSPTAIGSIVPDGTNLYVHASSNIVRLAGGTVSTILTSTARTLTTFIPALVLDGTFAYFVTQSPTTIAKVPK